MHSTSHENPLYSGRENTVKNRICPGIAPETRGGRREFLFRALAAGAGVAVGPAMMKKAHAATADTGVSTVSFIAGTNRREMVRQALDPLKEEVRAGIKGKRVLIKCNLVGPDPLCATHVDAVRGVLDFLEPLRPGTVTVGDSTGRIYPGPVGTRHHFEIHEYLDLPKEYRVKLLDLNDRPAKTLWIWGEKSRPRPINIIDSFLDPDTYLISLTRPKTHGDAVATLSVKNIMMGAPISHYRQAKAEGRNEKVFMHEGGFAGLHYNLFLLAQRIRPQLCIIDGLVGMEGNGPTLGTAVEHGIALAGADMVAVDRVALELMGIPFEDVGYLTYCARAGLGRGDLAKIHFLGPDIRNHIRKYRLHENIARQMAWKEGMEGK